VFVPWHTQTKRQGLKLPHSFRIDPLDDELRGVELVGFKDFQHDLALWLSNLKVDRKE
jgi:hypothetical protein